MFFKVVLGIQSLRNTTLLQMLVLSYTPSWFSLNNSAVNHLLSSSLVLLYSNKSK